MYTYSICVAAADGQGDFVAFEGSLQLYADLVNHRGSSGSWPVTTAGCTGLADAYLRMQVSTPPCMRV